MVFYDWQDPSKSGLLMHNKIPLTLPEIIGKMDLSNSFLVTLSACETGITDLFQSPDEYFGLPAAFLQAGAPTVLSTLWAVDDLSTMLLMENFYMRHIDKGEDATTALRKAQQWLRKLTAYQLINHFETFQQPQEKNFFQPDLLKIWLRPFQNMHSTKRPFEDEYYWAAFTISGA